MSNLFCDYCKKSYNDKNNIPLTLPCNHTVCKSCLYKKKNKNIFFCKKCNRNIILSSNLKPNKKILKQLQLKYQNQNKSKINQSNYSSNNENEEEEEQEEENEEQEQEEENEEGEEEEDDIDDEIVEEENSENENDNSESNENGNKTNVIEKKLSSNIDKRNSQVKSILKKNRRASVNQVDDRNMKKKNRLENRNL